MKYQMLYFSLIIFINSFSLPETSNVSGVIVVPSDLVPDHYQSFFKFDNVHMWSLQRPTRRSGLVTCKTQRGLTCIGFGDNVSPDLSYQKQSATLTADKNFMLEEPRRSLLETDYSKRIKLN